MLSRLFQRIAAKRAEKRFRAHFEKASGPVLHRNAFAIAMMELEDPWVAKATAEFSPEEQPIFLMAYQCFIMWMLMYVLQRRLEAAKLRDLSKCLREAFASFSYHTPAIFEKIWPCTQQLMPMALEGGGPLFPGKRTVYPSPDIILAATLAGYPLPQKILNYHLGVHPLVVMKRIRYTLNADEDSDATTVEPRSANVHHE